MKPLPTIKGTALAFALLALAFDGSAATLGRMQGAALIGRPLNLSVPVQLGEGEDLAQPCLEADVFHADNRQDPSRVRVTLEPAAEPHSAVVRIVSSVPVDEPLVTVYLRAGCSQKSTRRYVLLADIVSDVVAPPVVAATSRAAPLLPQSGAALPAAPVAAGTAGSEAVAASARRTVAAKPAAPAVQASEAVKAAPRATATPARADKPTKGVKGAKVRAAGAPTRSRLKVDMLDLSQERDPTLKASSELLSVPTADLQRRADAAALWRALNASPEDILRDAARVQAMDADISVLKTITERNQAGLQELSTRLRQAESERYANWLVYLLAALLLFSVAALAWLWRRHESSRREEWWRGSELGAAGTPSGQPEAPDTARSTVTSQRATLPPALTAVDIDLGQVPAAAASRAPAVTARPGSAKQAATTARASTPLPAPAAVGRASASLPLSTGGHLRDVDTQELVDIRHQAEFFMSLGQHDQAIEILEHRLAESGESSPLVFLDLLGILHTLGRKSEYEVVRSEFNRLFTGRMSGFTAFSDEGKTLDAYPDVARRICALWPSARVLEFMEDCIFRNPGDESGLSFDMAAYRELLLLHGVAKRIVRGTEDNVESKSAVLMRSPFKSGTFPMPVAESRRGTGDQPPKRPADGAFMHFDLPEPP